MDQADDPDARAEDERLIPAVVARRPVPPDVGGEDRERSTEERHVRHFGRGCHREEGDEEERERGEMDGHLRRAGRERRRDRRDLGEHEADDGCAREFAPAVQDPGPDGPERQRDRRRDRGRGPGRVRRDEGERDDSGLTQRDSARVHLRRPVAPCHEPRGDRDERERGRGSRVGRERQAFLRRDEEQQDVPEKTERRKTRLKRHIFPQAPCEGRREEVEEREPHGRGQPRFHEIRRHRLHEPRAENGERRDPADGVQERWSAEHGEREEPGVEKGKESEEEPPVLSVRADARDVEREERGQRRRDGRRPAEGVVARARLAAHERRPRREDERKDEEDPGREAQVLAREEADDPAPLVARREDQARGREKCPPFPERNPREPRVQDQEVREELDRAVFPCRQERGSREAAEKPERGDEQRVAPQREGDGERRDDGHEEEGGDEADQMPPGMPGEHRGEENRETRRVESVRRDGVTARGLELAGEEKADSREEADRHLHRRRQPPVVDRVAQKKDRADRQEHSGDPGEQLYADEALPVDARRRRRRGDRRLFCSFSHRSGDVDGRHRSSRIGDLLRGGDDRRSEGHRRDRECDRRSGPFHRDPARHSRRSRLRRYGLLDPFFPLRRDSGLDPRRCVSRVRSGRCGLHGSRNLPDILSERLDLPLQQRDALRAARGAFPQPHAEAERRDSRQEGKKDHGVRAASGGRPPGREEPVVEEHQDRRAEADRGEHDPHSRRVRASLDVMRDERNR